MSEKRIVCGLCEGLGCEHCMGKGVIPAYKKSTESDPEKLRRVNSSLINQIENNVKTIAQLTKLVEHGMMPRQKAKMVCILVSSWKKSLTEDVSSLPPLELTKYTLAELWEAYSISKAIYPESIKWDSGERLLSEVYLKLHPSEVA
ncbi:MAG: hypothetical protein NE330_15050 [Lentisphaeraceae bacterium]|nr:hypothetical protein [Lentisphaeraceae bacterium]